MRVYEVPPEEYFGVNTKSSATYTRLAARANESYPSVAEDVASPAMRDIPVARHRVQSGENLTRIVREFLSAQGKNPSNSSIYDGVRKVAEANRLHNADLIHPGQDLDLSVLQERVPLAANNVPAPRAQLDQIAMLPALDIPSPKATAPVDSLRGSGLTRSATPLPVLVAAGATVAPAPQLAAGGNDSVALGKDGSEGMRGAKALQRILNGTANTLAMVRDLMRDHHGADEETAESTNPWDGVLKGTARLSSEFGMRKDPFTGRLAFHGGIDLAAKRGTAITALRAGEVVYSGWKGGYGNTVVVRHDDGYETIYGHTAKALVAVGDTVERGAEIAKVGSTGRSTGPHLHLEIRRHGKPVNPVPHLEVEPVRLARNGAGS